jgi:hypothetical protein
MDLRCLACGSPHRVEEGPFEVACRGCGRHEYAVWSLAAYFTGLGGVAALALASLWYVVQW